VCQSNTPRQPQQLGWNWWSNRNSLEQDQERLRQFLDNLSHQKLPQLTSDVNYRIKERRGRGLKTRGLEAAGAAIHRIKVVLSGVQHCSNSSGEENMTSAEMDRFTGFHLLSRDD
jgi:chemosensory pili system protein ChpA (sensor histidine kinase/response regulator)